MSDQRDRPTCLDLEVDVVEDRALKLIAESDVVEANMPHSRRERLRIGRVRDVLHLVQHFEDPLAGSDSSLARADPHPEHPERHHQHEHVDVDRDELADLEVAGDDPMPPDEEHSGLREDGQEGEERDVERALTGRADGLGENGFIPPRELLLLLRLLGERLDDVDAHDVLLGDGGHVRHALLHLAEDWVRRPRVHVRDRDQSGGDGQRDQCDLPVEHEEDRRLSRRL